MQLVVTVADLENVFDWLVTTFLTSFFDNFLVVFASTGESKRENCGKRSW